jgi:hypothetical protein
MLWEYRRKLLHTHRWAEGYIPDDRLWLSPKYEARVLSVLLRNMLRSEENILFLIISLEMKVIVM